MSLFRPGPILTTFPSIRRTSMRDMANLGMRTRRPDTFSEKRIPVGLPMATLEDVLVPVYMFHRYQIEAAASVLGGLYYNHRLRGDVQKDPEIVPGSEQLRALKVLIRTIEPQNLEINEKVLNLIPPRPPGYRETRELLRGYTGATFDPLGAAEAVAMPTTRPSSSNKTFPGVMSPCRGWAPPKSR